MRLKLHMDGFFNRHITLSITEIKAFPLQGPCAVNPLQVVVHHCKVVPANFQEEG